MDYIVIDKTSRRGSVLVVITDRFTGKDVTLPVEVKMTLDGAAAPAEMKPIRKAPARYGFIELDSGEYRFSVESEFFISKEVTIEYVRSEGYSGPTEIELSPAPAYPFPSGTTLLYGAVVDATDKPVKGASVSVVERPEFDTETDDNGEFAIFFKGLKYSVETSESDFYKDENGVYYVIPKGGSESDIELPVRAEKEPAGTGEVTAKIIADKVNTLGTDEEDEPITIKLST